MGQRASREEVLYEEPISSGVRVRRCAAQRPEAAPPPLPPTAAARPAASPRHPPQVTTGLLDQLQGRPHPRNIHTQHAAP
jgi:hypothetical protein